MGTLKKYLQNMKRRRDVVWAAGFIDGEACISIKRVRRPKAGQIAVYYQPWIAVGLSNKPQNERAIQTLLDLFGGSSSEYVQSGNRCDTIMWQIASRQAYETAKKLLPYLVVKREQAEILIRLYEECHFEMRGGLKVSLEDLNKREKYFYEMRTWNVKGRLRLQRLSDETPETEKRQSELAGIEPQEELLSEL